MVISWDAFELYTALLGQKIKTQDSFDTIIAIATSGLPSALLISKILGIPEVLSLQISTYNRKGTTVSHLPDLKGKKVIIIDDIVSSGVTMDKAKELVLLSNPLLIKTASSVVSARVCKKYPDYFGEAIMRDEEDWITFPWDKYEK